MSSLADIPMLVSAPASLGSETVFAPVVLGVKGRFGFFCFVLNSVRLEKKENKKKKKIKEHFTLAQMIELDTCTSF